MAQDISVDNGFQQPVGVPNTNNEPRVAGVNCNEVEGYVRVPLAAVDTAGGLFSWANPAPLELLVTSAILHVTTASTGACTVDMGVAATATTSSDDLIDGVSVATTGQFNNVDNKGTNGFSVRDLDAGQFVTGSVASGSAAGIAGYALIRFVRALPVA